MGKREGFIKLHRLLTCFILAVVLCAVSFVQPVFADVSFSELGSYSIGYSADDMAAGDFNKDGYPDIIVVNKSSTFIGIFESNGSGGYEAISTISTGTYYAQKIATGDFNGDGNLDFAVTQEYGYEVPVFSGNGDGTFTGPALVTLSTSKALGIASCDFNEDGHTDLVIGDQETSGSHQHFRTLTNNGSGGFTVSGDTANGGAVYVHKIIAEDFDGDGHTDIAFLGDSSGYSGLGSFSIIYGDGTGSFGNSWYYSFNMGSTWNMDSGDINNDGLLDIFFARSPNSSASLMAVLVNQGSRAAFQVREYSSSTVLVNNYGVAAEDFNGDYEMDVVTVGDSKVRFWLGVSDYAFSESPDGYITAANNPKKLTTADFNKDGKVDIATVNSSGNTVSIYLNGYNFGPYVDAISATINGTEDGADITINASDMYAGYSDPDGDSFGGIKITKVPVGGTLKLGDSADITAGQEFLAADLSGKAFVYNPNDNWYGDAYIEWRPVDVAGAVGIIRKANMSIASVIDSPVNTVPVAQTVNEDTTLTFSTASGNAIQISDPDVEAAELMQVSLTAAEGTLTLSGTTDLTFSAGDGSGDTSMTFTGTLASINAALNGLTFNPAADYNGAASITIVTDDQGNAGAGTLSDTDTVNITVNAVNDVPSFTKGADQTVSEDSGAQSVTGWATGMSAGPSDESGQALIFTATNDNNSLFSTQPAVAANGTLTYTPADNANGSATVTFTLKDDGGTANGGVDTSAAQTFTITVNAVNDVPSFTKGTDQTVNEDCGVQSITDWATGISAGNANESGQTLTFTTTNDNNSLFSVQPAVAANGTLTYTPADNVHGSATVTLTLADNGGTASGGVDTSASQTFTITVNSVNDVPSFTKGTDQTVNEDSGVQSITGWATGMSAGPSDESGQALTFTATNDNNSLFSTQPAVAANGTLTFTPAANANGSAIITLTLADNGSTANGGVDTSAAQTFTITVNSVNDVPSFTKGTDQTVNEDSGVQSITDWATGISAGNANESGQTLTFTTTNDNNSLFSVQPAVAANGTLTYTPADNTHGNATVTLKLADDGGTANGGVDTSATQTFIITVNSVNDAPSFMKGTDQTVNEDCGAQSVTGWATGMAAGPSDESGQILVFTVTDNSNSSLFSVQPAVATDGTLTYTPVDNANGSATVTLTLSDNGGTANGGVDTSATQTFTITVNFVNNVPSFTKGTDQTVNEDCGAQTVTDWATGISAGNAYESSQTLTFNVTNDNNSLFSVQPAVAANGTLTYTPADNAYGSATVTLALSDNGGTANGGVDTSAAQTFTITVNAVNNVPSFTKGADQSVNEDCGAQSVAGWATGISAGNAYESGQTLTFNVTTDNNSLFSVQPVVAANGTLTYTPADNANGSATVTLTLKDDGGTTNGGVDTSAAQTFTITVNSVNDTPSFTKGTDQNVNEGCGAQTVTGWATGMSAGPSNESSQTLTFIVTNDNNSLFSVQPAIAANGTLTYTVADNTSGIAAVTVKLKDSGGNEGGGTDTSAVQTFIIKVCAQSGSGAIALSQDTFTAGKTSSTITFTYTAAAGGMAHGKLTIEVPSGWSSPSIVTTAEGYTTATTGTVGISGRTITVSDITVSSGDTISVAYGDKSGSGPGATASTVKGLYEWQVKSAAMADGTLSNLGSSPKIRIVPDTVSATQSSIAADKNNIPADGTTTASVTVILTDAYGNTVSGHNVSLSQGSGSSTISTPSVVSDDDGKAVFTVKSHKASTVTYTAKDATDNVTLGQTVVMHFKPGINISDTTISLVEGGSAEYGISLVSQPEDDVTVTGAVYGELGVSPAYLVFDTDNWDTVQIFTVTAPDNNSKDSSRMETVTNAVYSSDSWYNGLDFDITVNIMDNDTPGVLITPSSVNVIEGGAVGSYNVKLTTKPTDNVTVEIGCGSQLAVNPYTITFTPNNWNISQKVTVSAVDDISVEEPQTVSITHSVSSGDPDYDNIAVAAVAVSITDNDSYSTDASLSSLAVSKGTLTPGFNPGTTQYTVNVDNGVASITITPAAAESHAVITVNGAVVASGTASSPIILSVGKNTIEVKIVAQDNVTIKTYFIDVVRAAQHNDHDDSGNGGSSGGGGSGGSGGGTAPTLPATPPASTPAGNSGVTVEARLDSSTGTASASVSASTLANAFNNASAVNGSVTTVEVNIPKVEGATAYEPSLPASFLTSGDATKAVQIKTDIAAVTVPGNMLPAASVGGAQNVSLTIAAVDKTKLDAAVQAQIGDKPVIELNLKVDGQKASWSNEDAPVTVSVAYTPAAEELLDPEHITVWYIDGSGNAVSVPSGRYDPATGTVTFTTTHFSKYAVAFVQKNFKDLEKVNWAKKQIGVLTSKGIMEGRTGTEFAPSTGITRAEYVSALVRALGLNSKVFANFSDMKEGDRYYNEIGIAKKLGITSGVGGNKFNPNATISRQDMMVLTERALRSLKKVSQKGSSADLERFADKNKIAAYAVDSMASLVKEGLIAGGGSNINPLFDTTRAEAAVFLYRIYSMK